MREVGYSRKEAKVRSHGKAPHQDSCQGSWRRRYSSCTCHEPATQGDGGAVGICAKPSCVNKERGFINCWSVHHMSFVSFLVLIKIFMAKAARTLLAAHDAVFLLYRTNPQHVTATVTRTWLWIRQEHLTHTHVLRWLNPTFFIMLMFTLTLPVQISSLTADLWLLWFFFLVNIK